MEKLKLDLAELEVQSFAIPGAPTSGGTVRANDSVNPTQVNCPTQPDGSTCATGINGYTCYNCYAGSGQVGSCDNSCDCYSNGCDTGGCDVSITFYASMCPR